MTTAIPAPRADSAGPGPSLAIAAALLSVAIWANFLVTAGGVVNAGLGIAEIGLIRGLVCALALAPVILKTGLYPKALSPWRFTVMLIGGGLSFLYLMPLGFLFAPPATSGVFAPGLMPLWTALLSVTVLGERLGAVRAAGLALIALGVLGAGGWDALFHGEAGAWPGYLIFASASLCFACYAVAQQGSGLNALEATALVSFWLLPVTIVVSLFAGVDFTSVSPATLAWTALAQLGSGVIALITFTYAVTRLGSSRAAAYIALTPAAVALASDVFLGMPAKPLVWAGIAVVSIGVLIASGVMARRGGEV